MRAALALLAAALAVAGAAAGATVYDHDDADPPGDVVVRVGRSEPAPAERPGLDLLRAVARVEQGRVVQSVTFAAPLEEGASVTLHNEVGPLATAVVVGYDHDAERPAGEGARGSVSRGGRTVAFFPVEARTEGAAVTLSYALADVEAYVTCFEPAVVALALDPGPPGAEPLYEDLIEHADPHHGCQRGAATPGSGAGGLAAAAALGAALAAGRRR